MPYIINKESFEVTEESFENIKKNISLPNDLFFTYCWEEYCMPKKTEIKLLNFYINENNLNNNDKYTFIHIIFETDTCMNNLLKYNYPIMEKFKKSLMKDYNIHYELIRDYAMFGEDIDEDYYIIPFLRSIVKEMEQENLSNLLNKSSDNLEFIKYIIKTYWIVTDIDEIFFKIKDFLELMEVSSEKIKELLNTKISSKEMKEFLISIEINPLSMSVISHRSKT